MDARFNWKNETMEILDKNIKKYFYKLAEGKTYLNRTKNLETAKGWITLSRNFNFFDEINRKQK